MVKIRVSREKHPQRGIQSQVVSVSLVSVQRIVARGIAHDDEGGVWGAVPSHSRIPRPLRRGCVRNVKQQNKVAVPKVVIVVFTSLVIPRPCSCTGDGHVYCELVPWVPETLAGKLDYSLGPSVSLVRLEPAGGRSPGVGGGALDVGMRLSGAAVTPEEEPLAVRPVARVPVLAPLPVLAPSRPQRAGRWAGRNILQRWDGVFESGVLWSMMVKVVVHDGLTCLRSGATPNACRRAWRRTPRARARRRGSEGETAADAHRTRTGRGPHGTAVSPTGRWPAPPPRMWNASGLLTVQEDSRPEHSRRSVSGGPPLRSQPTDPNKVGQLLEPQLLSITFLASWSQSLASEAPGAVDIPHAPHRENDSVCGPDAPFGVSPYACDVERRNVASPPSVKGACSRRRKGVCPPGCMLGCGAESAKQGTAHDSAPQLRVGDVPELVLGRRRRGEGGRALHVTTGITPVRS
eukprot:gene22702-biopygen2763